MDILSEDHQSCVNLSFAKHEGTKGISFPSSDGMFIWLRVTPTCETGVSPRSITHKRNLLEVVFRGIKSCKCHLITTSTWVIPWQTLILLGSLNGTKCCWTCHAKITCKFYHKMLSDATNVVMVLNRFQIIQKFSCCTHQNWQTNTGEKPSKIDKK